jgi:hypothetical protein
MIAPMRPDRYLKMAAAMRREGMSITVGFASAAQRCPDRPGLVDELGTLTWRQLAERIDAWPPRCKGCRSPAGRNSKRHGDHVPQSLKAVVGRGGGIADRQRAHMHMPARGFCRPKRRIDTRKPLHDPRP